MFISSTLNMHVRNLYSNIPSKFTFKNIQKKKKPFGSLQKDPSLQDGEKPMPSNKQTLPLVSEADA